MEFHLQFELMDYRSSLLVFSCIWSLVAIMIFRLLSVISFAVELLGSQSGFDPLCNDWNQIEKFQLHHIVEDIFWILENLNV